MTYIKINKPSLDYHHYSDFHVFTMNNFVRNVMQNGKYKKAVRLVRLGLIRGLKELRYKLKRKDEPVVFYNFKYLPSTYLKEETKDKILHKLNIKDIRYEKDSATGDQIVEQTKFNEERVNYYEKVYSRLNFNSDNFLSESLDPIDSLDDEDESLEEENESLDDENESLDDENESLDDENELLDDEKEMKYCINHQTEINLDDTQPIDKTNYQYNLYEQLNFKKLYTKKPAIIYEGFRNLTVLDMVIQVYTMLTGVWYMRKAKVSGRTILIPSPLRPYRRVTTVTKMLMKGIRGRRKEERFYKNAMIRSIGTEFYWLLYYNGVQYGPVSISNSKVWLAKMDSHKELVYHLKNIKHLKYF